MRDCDFCKDRNIPPQDKQHADDRCPFASKEQIEALLEERAERHKMKQERFKQERFDTKKRAKNSVVRNIDQSSQSTKTRSRKLAFPARTGVR